MKFKYEMQIIELQMKLQSTTPQEVMDSISTTLGDYGKLFDESLQIWTSL